MPDARRSVDRLTAPRAEPVRGGAPPDEETLALILRAATTVPDHGGLRPWRFAVIAGAGQDRFADALEAGLLELRGPGQPEAAVAKMRGKAHAAPCTVALIASPHVGSNVPVWEQVASASCTGYAMVLAAAALGFGAVWKSAAVVDAGPVRALFRLTDEERLLGWVNLGSPAPPGRPRRTDDAPVELGALVTMVGADDRPYGSDA
ncbi:MAG: nitroreductase family protein [Acidimicrobiales bacterium]